MNFEEFKRGAVIGKHGEQSEYLVSGVNKAMQEVILVNTTQLSTKTYLHEDDFPMYHKLEPHIAKQAWRTIERALKVRRDELTEWKKIHKEWAKDL